MRSLLILVFAVLLLAGSACTQQPRSQLAAYVDLDLRKLNHDRKAELATLLAKLLPKEYQLAELWPQEPWAIWKNVFTKEKRGYILFQGGRLSMIPGQSRATVHIFDDSGKLTDTFAFSTGWRIDLGSAALTKDPALKSYCIDVRSFAVINGRDVRRQVYGLIENRLGLLWLEDSSGKMIPNRYQSPNHTIGPPVPMRDSAGWEKALSSDQASAILEALAWIGGHHRDGAEEGKNVHTEDAESAKLVADVRERQGVRKELVKLTTSDVPRIQEAAKLALEQLKK